MGGERYRDLRTRTIIITSESDRPVLHTQREVDFKDAVEVKNTLKFKANMNKNKKFKEGANA